jgi:glycine/D-amino acid oxidase-like deaminating enzyme
VKNERQSNSRHAVVSGGSITGLLAARGLSDHFDLVTVIERDRLDKCLREHSGRGDGKSGGLARRFQRGLARLNAAPWTLSTGEDYRYRDARGGAPNRMTRFMHRYLDRVLSLSTRDAEVRRRFLEVQGMLKPPSELFKPASSPA